MTKLSSSPTVDGPNPVHSRERILDAAVRAFSATGYRGTSLMHVAREAGFSKSGLMHHFPTKEDLLEAVLAERAKMQRDLRAEADGPLLDSVASTVKVNDNDETWSRFFTIIVAESLADNHPAGPQIRQRYESLRENTSTWLKRDYPELSDTAATEFASIIIAVMDGLQIQKAAAGDRFEMTGPFQRFIHYLNHYIKRSGE